MEEKKPSTKKATRQEENKDMLLALFKIEVLCQSSVRRRKCGEVRKDKNNRGCNTIKHPPRMKRLPFDQTKKNGWENMPPVNKRENEKYRTHNCNG